MTRPGAERGFTLIELLVVIGIVGVLAAIAVPQFAAYRRRGFDADAKSNIKNASISQEAYFTDKEKYTSAISDLTSWGFKQSPSVNIGMSGTVDAYSITATATAGCSVGTGIWSFDSSAGMITGTACD